MLATLILAVFAFASHQAPQTESLLITGARVLAPEGDRWLEGHGVLIERGRIARIAPLDAMRLDGVRVLDAEGACLVPGLIDLHTHLLLHPYDEASWEEQVLKEPLGVRTLRAAAAARATLRAGFTTVRDLGTEGAGYADVALRDAIAAGIAEGPRIVAVTRAIVASGAYGPAGFDPRWEIPKGAQVADGTDAVRRVVREQIAAGADWIKVYADYRRRPGAAVTPTFSVEELRALVDEARSAGLEVSAHATTPEGIRRAVEAGAHSIEHGGPMPPELLARMAAGGVVLCPTLAASEAMARYGGWRPGEPDPPRLVQAREAFQAALRAGVPIACGSDAGVFAHGGNARELELMVRWGMTPEQALRAATSAAAAVLGRQDDFGTLREGLLADLVLVRADPLAGISALREPWMVLQAGRVVAGPRPAPASGPR